MTSAAERSAPVGRLAGLVALPWVRVLLVYALSRAYSSALLGIGLAIGRATGAPFPGVRGTPTFTALSDSWDGWFYRSIATHGYPALPPVDAAGHVLPNEWAFLPVFPALERVLGAASGLPISWAGTVIAVVAGGGAAVLLERLLRSRIGGRRALWAVGLLAFGPLAFLLQVTYAESLFLLLVLAALLAIEQERYVLLTPLVVVAAFTRPGAIAIPAALALQLVARWRRTGRRPRHLGWAVVAIVIGGAASLAWPVVADLTTGRRGTYLATELSWWTGWVGRPDFVPFTPWFLITSRWLGVGGVLLAVALAAASAWWLLRRSPRELGGTVRAFSGVYVVYLAAVFLPQVSLPRLLLPLAPLLGSRAFTGSPARRRAWFVSAAALQPAGLGLLWFLGYP